MGFVCKQTAVLVVCNHNILRIDYCDEGPVYLNVNISATRDGVYTFNTSIKSPYFSLFNDVR